MRRSQPRSWANMRKVSSTSRCSPRPRDVAAVEHLVDRIAQPVDRLRRGAAPRPPMSSAISVSHDDARLVQHDVAEADALGEASPVQLQRAAHRMSAAGRGDAPAARPRRSSRRAPSRWSGAPRSPPRCRRGWARFCTTSTPRVLPAAQDRHAEEGVVDLLAGLRLVGEGRVVLRVGERERLGLARDQADEALAVRMVVRWTASRLRPSVA